jgi:hypothetical protein
VRGGWHGCADGSLPRRQWSATVARCRLSQGCLRVAVGCPEMVKHRTFWNTYSLPVKCGDTVAGRRPRWAVSALAWLGPTELARTRALKPDDMPRKMWSIRTSIAVLIRPNGCGRCPRRWRRVRRTRRKTRIRWRSSAREVAQKGFVYGSPFPHRYPGGHDPNGARVAFDLSPPTTSA